MAWDEHTNDMIAEDVHNVILDLVRYGIPLEEAIREGWTLIKEMVRLTSKDQPGKQDQNVFEDVIDMRRILHAAIDAVHEHLQLEPVAWAHSTLKQNEQKAAIEIMPRKVHPSSPKSYTLTEARQLFLQGNKYLAADVNVTVRLFLNNNQTMGVLDGNPFPDQVNDQDLRVEVSLPNKTDSGKHFAEIYAVFERSSLNGTQKTISLDEVINLFKLDPRASIWECDEVG